MLQRELETSGYHQLKQQQLVNDMLAERTGSSSQLTRPDYLRDRAREKHVQGELHGLCGMHAWTLHGWHG